MQSQLLHRPESPSAQPLSAEEQFLSQSLYSNFNTPTYMPQMNDHDLQQPIGSGFDMSYRQPSMYNNSFTSRARQNTSASLNPVSDPTFMTSVDVFGAAQAMHNAQQQSESLQNMRSFDYGPQSAGLKTNGKPIFNDPFGQPTASSLLQSHHLAKAGLTQSQSQSLGAYSNSNTSQLYMNGISPAQSHTPFGPHFTSNGVSMSAGGNSLSMANGVTNGANSIQEEISTIFVVGFPDDMSEREFQNMFAFSSGFEAATLKIPNKDSTAYGSGASAAHPSNGLRGGNYQLNYGSTFGGPNDPYNLLTVNQGGVVVDSRDGTASWPGPLTGPDDPTLGHAPAPRKQIIGFAKFRTRSEALQARDVLQGRRVDIEKGAVLKAEMAKKNLHTKRGVGILGGVPMPSVNNVPGQGDLLNGLSVMSGMIGGVSEPLSARDKELGAMGFANLAPRRDRFESVDDERERETRRRMGSLASLSMLTNPTRGARERAEEEERERRRKEREVEARNRIRSSTSAAFDAFHHVSTSFTPIGNPLLSPVETQLNSYGFPSFISQGLGSEALNGSDVWSNNVNGRKFEGLTNGVLRSAPIPINLAPGSSSSQQSSPSDGLEDAIFPNKSSASPSEGNLAHPGSANYSPPGDSTTLSAANAPRSRPYSPSNEIPRAVQLPPSMSSVSTSSSSSVSEVLSQSSGSSIDGDMSRALGSMSLSTTHQGMISPQLPSPGSGGSTGTRGNASDQNPPINTLYVGNLPTSPIPTGFPPNYLEESLRQLFSRCPGYRKLCFRQKSNGPMCFVEFDDVAYAAKALNDLYGHTLNGLVKGGIRLSYSKNPLGVRTPTNANPPNGAQQLPQAPQGYGQSIFGRGPDALSRHSSNLTIDMPSGRGFGRDPGEIGSPLTASFQSATSPPRFVSPPPPIGYGMGSQSDLFQRTTSQGFSLASPQPTTTFSPFGAPSSPQPTPQPQPPQALPATQSQLLGPIEPPTDQQSIPIALTSTTPSIDSARAT